MFFVQFYRLIYPVWKFTAFQNWKKKILGHIKWRWLDLLDIIPHHMELSCGWCLWGVRPSFHPWNRTGMSLSILSAAAGSWGQTCVLLPVVNDVRKIYNWLYNIANKNTCIEWREKQRLLRCSHAADKYAWMFFIRGNMYLCVVQCWPYRVGSDPAAAVWCTAHTPWPAAPEEEWTDERSARR